MRLAKDELEKYKKTCEDMIKELDQKKDTNRKLENNMSVIEKERDELNRKVQDMKSQLSIVNAE